MADRAENGYLDNGGETDFQVAITFPPTVRFGFTLNHRLVLTFISPSGA